MYRSNSVYDPACDGGRGAGGTRHRAFRRYHISCNMVWVIRLHIALQAKGTYYLEGRYDRYQCFGVLLSGYGSYDGRTGRFRDTPAENSHLVCSMDYAAWVRRRNER